jgi:hypothetical protein
MGIAVSTMASCNSLMNIRSEHHQAEFMWELNVVNKLEREL